MPPGTAVAVEKMKPNSVQSLRPSVKVLVVAVFSCQVPAVNDVLASQALIRFVESWSPLAPDLPGDVAISPEVTDTHVPSLWSYCTANRVTRHIG